MIEKWAWLAEDPNNSMHYDVGDLYDTVKTAYAVGADSGLGEFWICKVTLSHVSKYQEGYVVVDDSMIEIDKNLPIPAQRTTKGQLREVTLAVLRLVDLYSGIVPAKNPPPNGFDLDEFGKHFEDLSEEDLDALDSIKDTCGGMELKDQASDLLREALVDSGLAKELRERIYHFLEPK